MNNSWSRFKFSIQISDIADWSKRGGGGGANIIVYSVPIDHITNKASFCCPFCWHQENLMRKGYSGSKELINKIHYLKSLVQNRCIINHILFIQNIRWTRIHNVYEIFSSSCVSVCGQLTRWWHNVLNWSVTPCLICRMQGLSLIILQRSSLHGFQWHSMVSRVLEIHKALP